jgi:putative peptide zinc metalloprotease protein
VNNELLSFNGRARRAIAALVVALIAVMGSVVVASPATAAVSESEPNGSPVNTAIAQNTTDGTSVFKLAFQIRTITDATTVAPANAAIAIASCKSCQTVAIAVQIIFVIGSPTVFAPENAAVAVNAGCSFCDTLATAYQFIVQSSVPVRLTNAGKHELHAIYQALRNLEGAGLTAIEIQARVDELMKRLAHVLATEVEPIPGEQVGEHSSEPQVSAHSSSAESTTTTVTVTSTTSTSTSTSTTSTTTTTSTPPSS